MGTLGSIEYLFVDKLGTSKMNLHFLLHILSQRAMEATSVFKITRTCDIVYMCPPEFTVSTPELYVSAPELVWVALDFICFKTDFDFVSAEI